MPNLVTVEEVKNFQPPGETSALDWSGWDDTQVESVIDEVEEYIQRICNDLFYSKEMTYYLSGTGTDRIFLSTNGIPYKVLSAVSLKEIDAFNDDKVLQEYVEGRDYITDGHLLKTTTKRPVRVRYAVGRIAIFPEGTNNLKFTANFGHEETPLPVKRAVKWFTIVTIRGTEDAGFSNVSGDHGITQESFPDYSATYATQKKDGQPEITGYTEIDRLLADYVNLAGMMRII